MAGYSNRELGTKKEELAVSYLEKQGFVVRERNFRSRQGEIDIIGRDGEYLVFLEVKYRRTLSFDGALAAVGSTKKQRICRTADYYRYIKHIPQETPVRYDVLGIQGEEISWVKNAFFHR